MAKIFGQNSIRELASQQAFGHIHESIEIVDQWLHDYRFGTLKTDSETSREQSFNTDFFGRILGYREKPSKPFSFQPKSSTASGEIPDARICFVDEDKGTDLTFAVVELKGAKTSLDKPQRGYSNQTPVQQAFKYKPQYRGCNFVLVSNFFETRLYNDNLLDYESWTLEDLADPSDEYLNLKVFHFLLCQSNFAPSSGQSMTANLLLEARSKQQEITKKFYLDYRLTRLNLVSNFIEKNPLLKEAPSKAVSLAQKLIDRVVFACFAEDGGFIPDHSLAQVRLEAQRSSFSSLWQTLKAFFAAIDGGSEKLGIPIGFNGGLFKFDPELDDLAVDDDVLKGVLALGEYDFRNDLSVTVLGHIFEQSITDIENLRSDLEQNLMSSLTASSKRKTAGVYYTPDHVVRGIVANSLGKHLSNLEAQFLQSFGLKEDISDRSFEKRQRQAYLKYQEALQQIRVLDPACGSGAFLVAAYDYLLAENRRVADILGPDLMGADEFIRPILQKNLFGVDLNEESVEITKLSLWLKSANKGQKLTNLDSSILCGDSLVNSQEFSSNPFDWNARFKEVMDEGGFDVVVGNPPYVDSELMVKSNPELRKHIAAHYETASGNWDLYVPFFQKALDLTKSGGFCSMIIPNKSLIADYASTLRSYISRQGALNAVADLMADSVFEVDVYPVVLTVNKGVAQGPVRVYKGGFGVFEERSLEGEHWYKLLGDSSTEEGEFELLGTHFKVSSAATVSEAYELRDSILEDASATNFRVINTGTIDKFLNFWGIDTMKYIKGDFVFPIGNRQAQAKKEWYGKVGVVVAGMATEIEAYLFREDEYIPAKSTVVVTAQEESVFSEYAALALMNTDLFSELFTSDNKLNSMAGGFITISQGNLSKARFPRHLMLHAELLDGLGRLQHNHAEQLMSLSRKLRSLILSHYDKAVWGKGLRYWWLLQFPEFSKQLKLSLTLEQRAELLDAFEKLLGEANTHWGKIMEAKQEAEELARPVKP